jgi:hypothetical protein
MLGLMQVGTEYLVGNAFKPEQIILDIPPPPHASRHEAIFQCPVGFSQDAAEVQYSS